MSVAMWTSGTLDLHTDVSNYFYAFTINDVWDTTTAYSDSLTLFAWRNGGGVTNHRNVSAQFYDGTSLSINIGDTPTYTMTHPTWTFLVLTLDWTGASAGTIKIYVNANSTPVATGSFTSGTPGNERNSFALGTYSTQYSAGGYYHGHTMIFDSVISTSNMSTIYNHYKADYGIT